MMFGKFIVSASSFTSVYGDYCEDFFMEATFGISLISNQE